MIKLIKNKFIKYRAKKIVDTLINITDLVNEYKFEQGYKKLNILIKENKEFDFKKHISLNLTMLHLLFNLKKYDEFLDEFDKVFELINANKRKRYNFEYKQYYKGFLLNLKMIIYLVNGEIEKADIEKTNMLNFLEIKLPEEEFDILEYQYPIYDDNTIQDLFKNNKYYSNLSNETKEFITNYLKDIIDKLKKEV